MNSFEDNEWDFLDYAIIEGASSDDFFWTNNQSSFMEIDVSPIEPVQLETRCKRSREKNESCRRAESKSCREKIRREKISDRFLELSSILDPGRRAMSDKSALLNGAMRAIDHLTSEARELEELNRKLKEEIKNIKAEKIELREEKHILKADKEKMEQKARAVFNAAAGGKNMKMMLSMPNYGGYHPMLQWIPSAVLDISQDHVLRPPVA